METIAAIARIIIVLAVLWVCGEVFLWWASLHNPLALLWIFPAVVGPIIVGRIIDWKNGRK